MEQAKKEWQEKALRCIGSQSHHSLIPIAKTKTDSSEVVSMLMCEKCFHTIAMDDVWQYR